MNRTMNNPGNRTRLLATVSSLALVGAVCAASDAALASGDGGRPIIWIELGGQAERVDGAPAIFAPPFLGMASPADLSVLTNVQQFPHWSTGFDGKFTFEPEGSDWVLSAAIRYGRSAANRHSHHQTAGLPSVHDTVFGSHRTVKPTRAVYADSFAFARETHSILDFQAGKDIGLGLFGARGDSVFSAGVRFAQFTANSHATLHARPVYSFPPSRALVNPGKYTIYVPVQASYSGIARSSRSTRAIGPSLSWDASLPVAGNASDVTLNFDWGVNAAMLFGRQRARVHHQTKGNYIVGSHYNPKYAHGYTNPPADQDRSRSVTIPNAGGFAGLSLKWSNAKISFGYRGDFFFGAMDTGIDRAKKNTIGFNGPFASISVGLGD